MGEQHAIECLSEHACSLSCHCGPGCLGSRQGVPVRKRQATLERPPLRRHGTFGSELGASDSGVHRGWGCCWARQGWPVLWGSKLGTVPLSGNGGPWNRGHSGTQGRLGAACGSREGLRRRLGMGQGTSLEASPGATGGRDSVGTGREASTQEPWSQEATGRT